MERFKANASIIPFVRGPFLTRKRFLGSSIIAGALVLAVGCAFKSGELVNVMVDGGSSQTKSYGARGSDERFTWTEDSVTDRDTSLVWTRNAEGPLAWSDAMQTCAAHGMRLPSREELLAISDFMSSDLFPARDWHWSSTPGTREGTAWAVGLSAYSNANNVSAKSLVRCVRSR